MVKHICGQCDKKFTSEGNYLKHLCSALRNPKQAKNTPVIYQSSGKLSEKKILASVRVARRKRK